MNAFKQLISDDTGAPSAMRVAHLAVVIPVMIVWTVLSIKQGQMIIPDTKIVALVMTSFAGKSAQSLFENFTGIHVAMPPTTISQAVPQTQTVNPPTPGSGAAGQPTTYIQ